MALFTNVIAPVASSVIKSLRGKKNQSVGQTGPYQPPSYAAPQQTVAGIPLGPKPPAPAPVQSQEVMSVGQTGPYVAPKTPSPKKSNPAVTPASPTPAPKPPEAPAVTSNQPDSAYTAPAGSDLAARVKAMSEAAGTKPPEAPPAPPAPDLNIAGLDKTTTDTTSGAGGSDIRSIIKSLRAKAAGLVNPGEEENALNQQLLSLQGDTATSVAGLEGQGRGIPLGLIRGKQALLEKQGNLQQQTLANRIAALAAQRKADLEAANLELSGAKEDYLIERDLADDAAKQNAPIEVGGSLVRLNPETGQYESVFTSPEKSKDGGFLTLSPEQTLYDPVTGKAVYTAPGRAGSGAGEKAPETKDFNGVPYQWNSGSQQWEPVQTTKVVDPAQQQKLSEIKTIANDLLSSDSLNSAVGPISSRIPTIMGGTADFEAKFNQLKALLTIDNLKLLKGAMSDKDLALLQNVATALNLSMSQEGFRNELRKIIKSAENQGTPSSQGVTDVELQQMRNSGLFTEQEIQDYIKDQQTFRNDLSTSGNGSYVMGSRLAKVNNNPGNLRFAGQPGATQGEGGFARFPTPQAGYQALLNQINLDASRGHTLASFINKYAPPTENDTGLYVQQMAAALGIDPNTPLSQVDRNNLGRAMIRKESSSSIA